MMPSDADVTCIEKFKPTFHSDWYNTSVDVIGKHLSGLILFKEMPDQSMRAVFTNEAGIKFFDFEFQSNGLVKVHQIIRQLNKKAVVRTLQDDFKLLLMIDVGNKKPVAYLGKQELKFAFENKKESDYVVTDPDCTSLIRLEKGTEEKRKMEALLFSKVNQPPDSMSVEHFNFKMKISMKRLIR